MAAAVYDSLHQEQPPRYCKRSYYAHAVTGRWQGRSCSPAFFSVYGRPLQRCAPFRPSTCCIEWRLSATGVGEARYDAVGSQKLMLVILKLVG